MSTRFNLDRNPYERATVATWPRENDYAAIHAEQKRRMSVLAGDDYTLTDHDRFYLFRGIDAAGNEVCRTRRVSTMLAFLVQTDAAALAASCALNVAPGQWARVPDPDHEGLELPAPEEVAALEQGNAIWRRSRVDEMLEEWAFSLAGIGDLFLEVGVSEEDPNLAQFGALDADTVKVWYDSRRANIIKAEVCFQYTPPGADAPVEYKRVITADRYVIGANGQRTLIRGRIVTTDGDIRQDIENPLGVCTILHTRFGPRPKSPQLSACAFTGYEDVVAKSDSAATQLGAIGTRHANPKLITEGFQTTGPYDDATDYTRGVSDTQIAPAMAVGSGEKPYYLEVSLAGASALRDSTVSDIKAARDECPEFLMSESGANSSGTALSMRAAAFTGKLGPKQARLRSTLARAVSMCRALEMGQRWSDEMDVYVVGGAPPLPVDRAAELAVIDTAIKMRVLKQSDAVAAAQGLGIGPADADPTTYAEAIRAEDAALDARAVMVARQIAAPDAAATDATQTDMPTDATQATDAAPAVVPGGAAVQDTALNGAQAQFVLDTLKLVGTGEVSPESAISALLLANPTADANTIRSMVNAQPVRPPPAAPATGPIAAQA